jgi:hypothetical protein
MFAAFMLTQNAAATGPRREDSNGGSVLELKVPVTPMSDTDQPQIRAGAMPWRSPTLQARIAAATLTRKGPERQRHLAGPQSKMPLGFLQEGPLIARLRGGGEEPQKEPEKDAEADSKGKGEPDETTPEPEERAGTKPGLQELSGTKSGSPCGRQTQFMTDALLRVDETEVGKTKSSVVMPKGFGELPRTDPQYQGIQGFNLGDFSPLGGEVSRVTILNVTKGAGEAPSDDMGIVKLPVGETELGSRLAFDHKGKAKEHTAVVEGVSHTPAPVLPAEAPAAPAQQIRLPSSYRSTHFSAKDMAEGEGSGLKRRVTPMKSKQAAAPLQDDPDDAWDDNLKAKYQGEGVQMVLGGRVIQSVRAMVKRVLRSELCEGVTREQGLVNFIFRGHYTQGLDSQFFMMWRQNGPAVYPTWTDVRAQDGQNSIPQEKIERQARVAVAPTQANFDSLAVGTELIEEELQHLPGV